MIELETPIKDHALVPHSERLISAVISNYIDNMHLPEPPHKCGSVHRVFAGLCHQPGVMRLQCYAHCDEGRYEKDEVHFAVEDLSLRTINDAVISMNQSPWREIGGPQ
jgi:hypothetical protein